MSGRIGQDDNARRRPGASCESVSVASRMLDDGLTGRLRFAPSSDQMPAEVFRGTRAAGGKTTCYRIHAEIIPAVHPKYVRKLHTLTSRVCASHFCFGALCRTSSTTGTWCATTFSTPSSWRSWPTAPATTCSTGAPPLQFAHHLSAFAWYPVTSKQGHLSKPRHTWRKPSLVMLSVETLNPSVLACLCQGDKTRCNYRVACTATLLRTRCCHDRPYPVAARYRGRWQFCAWRPANFSAAECKTLQDHGVLM